MPCAVAWASSGVVMLSRQARPPLHASEPSLSKTPRKHNAFFLTMGQVAPSQTCGAVSRRSKDRCPCMRPVCIELALCAPWVSKWQSRGGRAEVGHSRPRMQLPHAQCWSTRSCVRTYAHTSARRSLCHAVNTIKSLAVGLMPGVAHMPLSLYIQVQL